MAEGGSPGEASLSSGGGTRVVEAVVRVMVMVLKVSEEPGLRDRRVWIEIRVLDEMQHFTRHRAFQQEIWKQRSFRIESHVQWGSDREVA